MTDQSKKSAGQIIKRNTEEEQCRVYLEASLGISVSSFTLSDTIIGKGNKLSEGLKSRVFITNQEQLYKFYLGHFRFDKLIPMKTTQDGVSLSTTTNMNLSTPTPESRVTKYSKVISNTYRLLFGQANLFRALDLSEIPGELTSSTSYINPFKNKDTSFKYLITGTGSGNVINKLSGLKTLTFEIVYPIKCCDCNCEETYDNPMIFCWTDKKYFCTQCDKNWHEQKEKRALTHHYRTHKYKYTLTYFGNCLIPGHLYKPYEYFDEKNKTCLCVKCVESLNSNERVNQDITYIDDYLKVKKTNEDYLNSLIESVCDDIDQRLAYAESVWEQVDAYEKKYYTELEEKRASSINMMKDEGYARTTFLSCIFMEIQRIIKEIDSKVIFNKIQRNNADVSTFLYMNQIYLTYMQKELTSNLDFLASTNLETFLKPIIAIDDLNMVMYPQEEFMEYERKDDYYFD